MYVGDPMGLERDLAQQVEATDDGSPGAALVPAPSLAIRLGRRLQPIVDRVVAASSRVGDPPVHDAGRFAWTGALERGWADIRDEAAGALRDLDAVPPLALISPDHRDIAPAGKWRSLFLYGYGYRDDANCRRCPRTAALLAAVPGLNSAFFSVLVPGTHIPAHVGVTKALLTCHLGIRVPREPATCRMRVADREVRWHAGRALVFDDTVEHEVWNDSGEVRVVLLIQFRRPVGPAGRIVGGAFLWAVRRSRFVQDARRGVRAWAEQHPI